MTSTALTLPSTGPVVTIKDDRAFANSRNVAELFGKQHKHVLDAIESIVSTDPECQPNFRPTSDEVRMPYGGVRFSRSMDMDQEGFTLLAMGFTGAKALQFKRMYIRAFNAAMEEIQKLRNKARMLPDFSNPAEAARAWAEQFERADASEAQLRLLRPKAEFAEGFLMAEGTFSTTEVAAQIGMSAQSLNGRLQRLGVVKKSRRRWIPRQEYNSSGYFVVVPAVDSCGVARGMQMRWTPDGIRWLTQTMLPDVFAA